MQNTTFIGEHVWAGWLGHALVILSFTCALFSAITYYMGIRQPDAPTDWKKVGRWFFFTHVGAVILMFGLLLFMLFAHYFEYQYVWQHTKPGISLRFIFAAMWEGQEGSTMLWVFWQAVLGLILIFRTKQWEAPVLCVIALVQVFLSSMLLGIYFNAGDLTYHIGTSPFLLLREHPEFMDLPFTKAANYVAHIGQTARGLNPLLQNYWMTIHPPTLFLGFALTVVPFAFALGGLLTKKYHEWQEAALPWAYTGIAILGTGILMGGAWAYESLSFGGFWAWDPVENASLVPWLTLVGAAHVMMIYRIKGQSLFTTFFLCIVSFLLVVYSTFLTKSGVLQNTSVHAFTDNGLSEELAYFMGFFTWLAVALLLIDMRMQLAYTVGTIVAFLVFMIGLHAVAMFCFVVFSLVMLIISYRKFFPKQEKEEDLWSREFWMFIGALVLLVSAMHIIFFTSLPVFNHVLNIKPIHSFTEWLSHQFPNSEGLRNAAQAKLAPGKHAIYEYNRWQSAFAVIVCLLMAVGQYFKYRKTDMKQFGRKMRISFFVALLLTVPAAYLLYFNGHYDQIASRDRRDLAIPFAFLFFATIFSVMANGDYFLRILKGKIKNAGGSIAHIGFGLLLLGALVSTSQQHIISATPKGGFDVRAIDTALTNSENIALFEGEPRRMGDWSVVYSKKEKKVIDSVTYYFYNVDYYPTDASGKISNTPEFTLRPFLQINKIMGNAIEPDTRHWANKDLYTFLRVPDMNFEKPEADNFTKPVKHDVHLHDTLGLKSMVLIFDTIRIDADKAQFGLGPKDMLFAAQFRVFDDMSGEKPDTVYAYVAQIDSLQRLVPLQSENKKHGLRLSFWDLHVSNINDIHIELYTSEEAKNIRNYIVLQAIVFPWINVLWIGCIVMVIGTVLAIRQRLRLRKNPKPAAGEAPDETAAPESVSEQ